MAREKFDYQICQIARFTKIKRPAEKLRDMRGTAVKTHE